jgi:hypothetical protein
MKMTLDSILNKMKKLDFTKLESCNGEITLFKDMDAFSIREFEKNSETWTFFTLLEGKSFSTFTLEIFEEELLLNDYTHHNGIKHRGCVQVQDECFPEGA